MPEDPIYFDHHATTPCDPRVVERMLPFFSDVFGNPASLTHAQGRRAANAVEDARIAIARFFKAQPNEIYFTAGATESNNIALNLLSPGDHLVTSAVEHRSILAPAERLAKHGMEVTILAPDREGFIDPEGLRDALRPNTRLVSVEAANGEIGTLQPIDAFATICRERGVLFHSDVTQAAGKIPLDLSQVDLASFSAHKFYGPKGIGALYVRRGVRVEPLVIGGGQEKNFRSGTVNVPGVIGMSAAIQLRAAEMEGEAVRLTELRNMLWDRLLESIAGVSVNGPRRLRLPGNLNVSFERLEADSLIVAMRRFALSSGSACSSGQRGPSPVLKAIGLTDAAAIGSIRIGLGKSNTEEQIAMFIDDARRTVAKLREISAA
ncbi:MAG TPA: cysteine desulfurase family protein [Thermoanaerobaculia bacterium]|nr:cysteine desulfurase family protein [Thermoanaerobaculia bacterium]